MYTVIQKTPDNAAMNDLSIDMEIHFPRSQIVTVSAQECYVRQIARNNNNYIHIHNDRMVPGTIVVVRNDRFEYRAPQTRTASISESKYKLPRLARKVF